MHRIVVKSNKLGLKLNSDFLSAWGFICCFAMPFLKMLIKMVTEGISTPASIVLTYVPVVLILLIAYKRIPIDFIILLGGVAGFFGLTYLVHPEYEFWYTRTYYGVWDYVLRPDNGIYFYLFIRLVNEPKKILKYLRISSWLMYIHLGIQLMEAMTRGYWISSMGGVVKHVYYSLDFGYDVLLYDLVFFYAAFKYKRPSDWIGAILGTVMILVGGSRGPILDIMIFVLVYMSVSFMKSRKKTIYILVLLIATPIFMLTYMSLLQSVAELLENLGISSRFIRTIMNNSITDDNGRMVIWLRALQMIRDNPFGYGAMGTRHVIYSIISVGHPHNVFLEILVDFGVIVGTGIIVFFIVQSVRILLRNGIDEWKGLFMIFFAQSCQLLLSGTFWHRGGIWSALAIGMCIYYQQRIHRMTRRQRKIG